MGNFKPEDTIGLIPSPVKLRRKSTDEIVIDLVAKVSILSVRLNNIEEAVSKLVEDKELEDSIFEMPSEEARKRAVVMDGNPELKKCPYNVKSKSECASTDCYGNC